MTTSGRRRHPRSLGIRGIPTLLLYQDGKEVARQSGAMSAGQITAWVRQHMRVKA